MSAYDAGSIRHHVEFRICSRHPATWVLPFGILGDGAGNQKALKEPSPGERYAISLAIARNLPLLVEDRKARLIADQLSLKRTGALGMILAARETGRLSTVEARASIEALHQSGRISGHLQDMALARITGH